MAGAGTPSWAGIDRGQGRPLVLLHGLGMRHTAWAPVLDTLAASRRVIALDVPGFGATPPLPSDTAPTLGALATALRAELRARSVDAPVDIAGNSMGGGIALALALQGGARSVAALSPAGVWPDDSPLHTKWVLRSLRLAVRHGAVAADLLLRVGTLRRLMLALPLSIDAHKVPVDTARQLARDLAGAPGALATLNAIEPLQGLSDLTLPIQVAFGRRDWLLTGAERWRPRLPPHTRWSRPARWGHVPMWDDPAGVAAWILEATS